MKQIIKDKQTRIQWNVQERNANLIKRREPNAMQTKLEKKKKEGGKSNKHVQYTNNLEIHEPKRKWTQTKGGVTTKTDINIKIFQLEIFLGGQIV